LNGYIEANCPRGITPPWDQGIYRSPPVRGRGLKRSCLSPDLLDKESTSLPRRTGSRPIIATLPVRESGRRLKVERGPFPASVCFMGSPPRRHGHAPRWQRCILGNNASRYSMTMTPSLRNNQFAAVRGLGNTGWHGRCNLKSTANREPHGG